MAKRITGVEKTKTPRNHKTKKRLEAKKEMLRIKDLKPLERRKILSKK